jgi:hypothetical protein
MKKLLILFAGGLGDVINITPHMRYFYRQDYKIDLMCRQPVIDSHLLDECPYIDKLIPVPNPWEYEGKEQEIIISNEKLYEKRKNDYDFAVYRPFSQIPNIHKIDMTCKFFNMPELKGEDRWPEIFISEENQKIADDFLTGIGYDNFRFIHNKVEIHPQHSWPNVEGWLKNNMEEMESFNTAHKNWGDINITFAVLNRASQVILCSSVFMHAADSLGKRIDVAFYGNIDRKVWPIRVKPRRICEGGHWL